MSIIKEFVLYEATDKCVFPEVLYRKEERSKSIAIFIHGNAANFFKMKYLEPITNELLNINIDFLSADNRGREQYVTTHKEVNGEMVRVKVGTMYENFNESVYDIEGLIKYVKKLNYETIYLSVKV